MQDHSPGAGQPEISGKSTDQHAGMHCAVDLCAATYKSFNAADCTYQPYGGGQRSICELNPQSASAHSQPSSSPAANDSSPKAPDAQPAAAMQSIAKATASDRSGPECNRSLCAATYKSFNAGDCTYEPLGGGPRAVCGLSKGPTDASQQALRPPADSEDSPPEADEVPVTGVVRYIVAPAMPDEAGPQCNRSRCAAAYQSFHAADCSYQPEGGGPRQICEP
jgi:hypothetical protein